MTEKKQSLFKQRMKQQPITKPPSQTGFPQVIKLAIPVTPTPNLKPTIPAPPPTKPILQTMKEQHLIQDKQYDEIDKQNSDYLSKLSDKEIEEMQKQLQQELPEGFLEKLRKAVEKPEKEKGKVMEEEEVGMEEEEGDEMFRVEDKGKKKIEDANIPEELIQAREGLCERFSKLIFNPATHEIGYNQQESPEKELNLNLIRLLMESGNNQSVITGMKVLGDLIQALAKQNYAYGMAIMADFYWDYWVLLDYIREHFIVPAFNEFENTNFKTWRLQFVETVLKFVAAGGKISERQLQQIMQESQKHKKQANFTELITKCKNPPTFVSIWQKLNHSGNTATFQQLMMLLNNPAILVQKLIIQFVYYSPRNRKTQLQLLTSYFQNLASKAKTYPGTCQSQLINTLNILYRIVEISVLKIKMKSDDKMVRIFLSKLGEKLNKYLFFMVKNRPKDMVDVYRGLFVLRWCRKMDFIQLLQKIQEKDDIEPVIALINVKLYIKDDWPTHQTFLFTKVLQMILSWTADKQSYLNMQLILLQLLKIFRHQKQSYHNLPQSLLDNTIQKVIQCCSPAALTKLFTIPRIKQLVNGYIFNSFGNIVFSKVLIFFQSNLFDKTIQLYISMQCFERYPFIFYEAGKNKFYEIPYEGLYLYATRSDPVKSSFSSTFKMLQSHHSQPNNFLKLLSP